MSSDIAPVDLRPLTEHLGGRVDSDQPVRHDRTGTCRYVTHTGT
jgi:hypothetical protein